MEPDDQLVGFRWETEYERTWQSIQVSKDGRLLSSVPMDEMIQRNKKLRAMQKKNLRLGLMRHIFIVIDLSEAMTQNDLKPSRIVCTLKLLSLFLNDFPGLNPISQIGIIATRNKKFEVLSPMSSDMRSHMTKISELQEKSVCSGEPSLQNSLEYAMMLLKHMPNHTSKEVIVIMGSLTTCDPGDINSTIQSLSSYNIRCSIINLAAEVSVCKTLAQKTKGTLDVILDDDHFKSCLLEHLKPPPAIKGIQSSLIRMGFSQYVHNDKEMPSMCSCHLNTKDTNFSCHGYYCPQCQAKYCELPIGCYVCGLTLVSASHLARSFHHLFPVEMFEEEFVAMGNCFACNREFEIFETNSSDKSQGSRTNVINSTNITSSNQDNAQDQVVSNCSRCTLCKNLYCFECNIFIHENLHFCPGCQK